MNKKLIAIGIAAALAAPLAAQAGVEVYGDARVSLDFVNNNASSPAEDNTVSLSSNYSYLGFKGDEDLGAGLTALWQIEQEVDFDNGTWGNQPRDTYVGVAGGFGSVMAGNIRTPYRLSTMRLDPFANTRGDFNAIIGSVDGFSIFNDESWTNNTIEYTTPDLNGFNAALAYMLSDVTTGNDTLAGRTSATKDKDGYSLSVGYNNGPIFATAGYESLNKVGFGGGTGTPDAQAYKLGGSYTIMDATTIGALFENIDLGGIVGDRNAWSVDVSHKIGSTTLMAAYNGADKTKISKTAANQFSVGVKQALSKNTEVYALWTQVSNDSVDAAVAGSGGGYSLDNTPGGIAGKDMWAVSFGINHMFSSK